MATSSTIDTDFDFRWDTPPGGDPDALSPTLRRYHKFLWSKPLPCGAVFELADTTPGVYLHHCSELGEFNLTSDSVVPSFSRTSYGSPITEQVPDAVASFVRVGYTIGGMMLFPGNRVGRRNTINGARGFHPRIRDRFDLTVECIRRHYLNGMSPLSDTLARYSQFFRLFGDFRGYIEFFFLQDLVTEDCSAVKFSMPFDEFKSSPVPTTVEAYLSYRDLALAFLEARNQRIANWVRIQGAS